MKINQIFEREGRALCGRQNIAFHDWQQSKRASDTIFVRGVQANGERLEVWALEFRPKLHFGPMPETDPETDEPIELKRAQCVMVAAVGFEQPDCIIEETHAYNQWAEHGPEWHKSNREYEG